MGENMRTESRNDWIDMNDSELSRTYHFPKRILRNGTVVPEYSYFISKPIRLCVKDSGSHVVENEDGFHYISKEFDNITWEGEYDFDVK